MLTPILPFINDTAENINGILEYCIEAKVYGVLTFAMRLTLRSGSREYFYNNLDKHFSGLKEKYVSLYGNSYYINSPNNKMLMKLFRNKCIQNGIEYNPSKIFSYLNKFEQRMQPELF